MTARQGQSSHCVKKGSNRNEKLLAPVLALDMIIAAPAGRDLLQGGMNCMNTEEDNRKEDREDPEPLTDEEFEKLKRKEKRTGDIISAIIDFITGFFT